MPKQKHISQRRYVVILESSSFPPLPMVYASLGITPSVKSSHFLRNSIVLIIISLSLINSPYQLNPPFGFKHTQLAYSLLSLHLQPLSHLLIKAKWVANAQSLHTLPPSPPDSTSLCLAAEPLSLRPLKSCKSPMHCICFSPCVACLVTAFNSVDHFLLLQTFSSLNFCATLLCSSSDSVDTSQPPFQACLPLSSYSLLKHLPPPHCTRYPQSILQILQLTNHFDETTPNCAYAVQASLEL